VERERGPDVPGDDVLELVRIFPCSFFERRRGFAARHPFLLLLPARLNSFFSEESLPVDPAFSFFL
jgi:hypothetical protein